MLFETVKHARQEYEILRTIIFHNSQKSKNNKKIDKQLLLLTNKEMKVMNSKLKTRKLKT